MSEFIICASNWHKDGVQYDHSPRNVRKGFVVSGRR